jgi:hypothetical protein
VIADDEGELDFALGKQASGFASASKRRETVLFLSLRFPVCHCVLLIASRVINRLKANVRLREQEKVRQKTSRTSIFHENGLDLFSNDL